MFFVPKRIYLAGGVGKALAEHELLAFDRALANAGVADFNLIRVSSIVPPHCEILYEPPKRNPGMLAPTVYSKVSAVNSNEDKPLLIAACIALATCQDPNQNGVIFEVALCDADQNHVHNVAIDMVKLAMQDRCLDINHIYTKTKELYIPKGEAGCVVITAMME